ncbi:hypothetical protein HY025_05730 [Candidatus Daviesbacteria bacterium]|nr:hypothetical protein [Candidatus Daviesbacteria bacterium]
MERSAEYLNSFARASTESFVNVPEDTTSWKEYAKQRLDSLNQQREETKEHTGKEYKRVRSNAYRRIRYWETKWRDLLTDLESTIPASRNSGISIQETSNEKALMLEQKTQIPQKRRSRDLAMSALIDFVNQRKEIVAQWAPQPFESDGVVSQPKPFNTRRLGPGTLARLFRNRLPEWRENTDGISPFIDELYLQRPTVPQPIRQLGRLIATGLEVTRQQPISKAS